MNPYQTVIDFENMIAEYAGVRYCVALESATAGIFLSCLYRKVKEVSIPKHTYVSVPASVIHAGGSVKFTDEKWEGVYELSPYEIYDGALRFQKGMYKKGLHILSFHIKKHLPIGRGGCILTNDYDAAEWFKLMRFDGRHPVPLNEDNITLLGYNFYMSPDQASRGIQLFNVIKDKDLPDLKVEDQSYPDLSQFKIYQ